MTQETRVYSARINNPSPVFKPQTSRQFLTVSASPPVQSTGAHPLARRRGVTRSRLESSRGVHPRIRERRVRDTRVVFGILVASRGSPVSTTPEPDACAKWLDTLRADFESRYSSGAYVGRTKTIGRGDSYNFDNFTAVLRKHAASFDVDVELIPGIGLARKKLEDVTLVTSNNIAVVVNGRERLEDIEERTEDLRETASLFRGESVRVTREIWWRSVRMHLVTAVAVMLGMFVVFLAACGGYGCLH